MRFLTTTVICFIICLFFVPTIAQENGPDPYEDDDTADLANEIIPNDGAPQKHNFHTPDDEDWLVFYGVPEKTYVIKVGCPDPVCNIIMELYDENDTELPAYLDIDAYPAISRLTWHSSEATFYYVRIYSYLNTIHENTAYSVNISTKISEPDKYEPDDTFETARDIVPNNPNHQEHNFHVPGDTDWVRFRGISNISYIIEAVSPNPESFVMLDLFSESKTPLGSSDTGTRAGVVELPLHSSEDTFYYVRAHQNPDSFDENTTYYLQVKSKVDYYENDDDSDLAKDIFPDSGTPQLHNFHDPNDDDWVRFYGISDETYIIEAEYLNTDCLIGIELYDQDDSKLLSLSDNKTQTGISALPWHSRDNGSYYIKVYQNSGTGCENMPYHLRVKTAKPDKHEPDDSFRAARPINPGDQNPQQHNFHIPGDEDWIRFSGKSGMNINITAQGIYETSRFTIELYESDGQKLLESSADSVLRWSSPADSSYYARILHNKPYAYGEKTAYELKVNSVFWPDSYEKDDTLYQATDLSLHYTSQDHNFHKIGDKDWFVFVAESTSTYNIVALDTGTNCDIVIELHKYEVDTSTGEERLNLLKSQNNTGFASDESLELSVDAGNVYYVKVRNSDEKNHGENTEYSLRLNDCQDNAISCSDNYEKYDPPGADVSVIYVNGVVSQRHNFYEYGDEDWVAIDGKAGVNYRVTVIGADGNSNFILGLYDEQRNLLGEDKADNYLTWNPEHDMIYNIKITPVDTDAAGENTAYDILIYSSPESYDKSDTPEDAYPITVADDNSSQGFYDDFHQENDEDWLKFYGTGGDAYNININGLGENSAITFDIYDADSFMVTKESLERLKAQGVSEEILAELRIAEGSIFASKEEFEDYLKNFTEEDDTISMITDYSYMLLASQEPSGVSSDASMTWVPPDDNTYLVKVKNSNQEYGRRTEYNFQLQRMNKNTALEPEGSAFPGAIEGYVTCSCSGEPVEGARIKTSDGVFTSTSSSGWYHMIHDAGTYSLTVEAPSYAEFVDKQVVVRELGDTELNISMVPLSGKTAVPTFSPKPGTYTESQEVKITSNTQNAIIRYTADGNDPNSNSQTYANPIYLDKTTTITARAHSTGCPASDTVKGTYTITGKVAAPLFSPPPGNYTKNQSVELSCPAPENAIIHYTTDDSDPTESSPAYEAPINVSSSIKIKAKAFKSGWTPSETAQGEYTITGKVATPVFSPGPGTYPGPRNVEISCSTSEAVIHYTEDDTEPAESSPVYSDVIQISSSKTIKAKALKTGWTPSQTATGIYTITGKVATPVFSPDPGMYPAGQNIEISCPTTGAILHYTTDSTEPTESSLVYTSPISVLPNLTIKAKAFKTDWTPSDTATGAYTITGKVATPLFSPAPGNYAAARDIELSCDTPGAVIRYTTNSTDELTESSPVYETPIRVASSMTIRAKAFKTDWTPSDTATGAYIITGKVATPLFSPVPGNYAAARDIELSCDTPGAIIRYTTNSTDEPAESSPVYESPIRVASSMTIRAKAFKTDWTPSDTATGVYTITETVATPLFSPDPGTYPKPRDVKISCPTSGAVIHYTTEGTEPAESSPVYSNAIQVSSSMIIKAKAFKTGWTPSSTEMGIYTITGKVAVPVFSPEPGTYPTARDIEMSCSTPGAIIHYTTDNTEPTENSLVYTTHISVSSGMTIKAKAFKTDWIASDTATGPYIITGKVASPVFSPGPGTYASARNVELSCATPGAVIHYTTDTSEPTENSLIYSNAIPVFSNMTIKAKAFKTDWEPGDVATGVYIITGKVASPLFSPVPGIYTAARNIELSCSSSGAIIHYTTDGSEPTENSQAYATPIPVSSSMTIKAKAFKTDWTPSDTAAGEYTITGKVATPVFSPGAGTYPLTQNIELSCGTPGAVIHYTTDGSEPTESSVAYSAPISASSSMTVKAKAFKTDWAASNTATGVYTITGTVASPLFSPVPGTYATARTIELSCSTDGASVHYTTDDSEPTESSPVYTTPISVSSSMTIKAKAFKTGWIASDTATGIYKITGKADAPVFSPAPGTYPTAINAELSCATPGSAIHYTTDSSEPTESSLVYSAPIPVASAMTIKAKAFKTDWIASNTATGVYTITGTVAEPVFLPAPGTYLTARNIELSCSTPGATIHYTTDSSEPTGSSPAYTTPIPVSSSMTIKAKAFKTDWIASKTATGVYTITGTIAVPDFFPDPGTYPAAQNAELSCSTSGAVIHYTTDGTEPTGSSPAYATPIPVPYTMAIKAKAFKTGWADSSTATGVYIITGKVAEPVISPPSGTYPSSRDIELSCITPGAIIHYTTDGSEPTQNSQAYKTPVHVFSGMTIKAKAFKAGWRPSNTVTGIYTITGTIAIPVFLPVPGTYSTARDVELACSTDGAVIRYTTDGSEPGENSAAYVSPITVSSSMTIKAKAFKAGWTPSPTAAGTYNIIQTVENPVFSPVPGVYATHQEAELSCPTPGAVIHYTTDGSEPGMSSPVYSSPILVSENRTIKAKAFKEEWYPSAVATGTYIITGTVETPTFSPVPKTYDSAVSVEMSCATSEAYIHYTTDGSEPTESSRLYTKPVIVSSTTTVRARAYRNGWTPSAIAAGEYTITEKVEDPFFDPDDSKTYTTAQNVRLKCATPGADIYYTTDRTEPTQEDSLFSNSEPISVAETMTIRAKAFKSGWFPSDTVTGSYKITGTVESPVFSPDSDIYTTPQDVELSCATSGSVIRYTTDGTEPTENSSIYSGTISVTETTTINAKAFKHKWGPSATATGSYIITVIESPDSGGGGCFLNTLGIK